MGWKHWKHWKSGRDGRRLLSEQMKADDSDQVFQMRPDSDLLSEQMKDDDSDQVFQMRPDSDLPSEQMKDDDSEQVFQMRPDSELEPEPTRALLGYHDPCRDCHYPHCPHWCNTHPPQACLEAYEEVWLQATLEGRQEQGRLER